MLLASCGILYALFGSRRLAPSSFRREEQERGYATAKVVYAAVVCALVAVFPSDLHIVAGAWAILALGDGSASLAGTRTVSHRLPWNRQKTWLGLLAFVVAGGVAATLLIPWVSGRYPERTITLARALPASLLAALAAAVVESFPIEKWIDDNLTVPLASAAVLGVILGGLQSWPFHLWRS
jgi:phytol kinase